MPLMSKIEETQMVEIAIDINTKEYHRAWMSLAVPAGLDDDQAKELILEWIRDGKIDVWDYASCVDSETESTKVHKLNRLQREGGASDVPVSR